jgi:hypothetical protein
MNEQIGERNESFIGQSGLGARNTARAKQEGADNQVKQVQYSTEVSGTGNDAGAQQGGSFATVANVAPEALTQQAAIIANVDADAATVYYSAPTEGNKALQTQVGMENSAGVRQRGGLVGSSNYAEQEQDGTGNVAGIYQGKFYGGDPSNYAKQDQDGDDNTAGIVQVGSGHKSFQNQDDNNNTSLVSQRGKDHRLNTHQSGDGSVAHAVQHGLGNRALMVQYDGQSYTVEQNKGLAFDDYSGGGNQADILQMGPDGDFGASDWTDCEFSTPEDLNMDYTVPGLNLGDICVGCN